MRARVSASGPVKMPISLLPQMTVTAILLLTSSLASAAISCPGKNGDDCITAATAEIEEYLKTVQVSNGEGLYGAQERLMLPIKAAFETDIPGMRAVLIRGLSNVLDHTVTLGSLRQAGHPGVAVDPALLDQARAGRDTRRIFPTQAPDAKGVNRVSEERLNELQFSYLLSTIMKASIQSRASNPRPTPPEEAAFVQRCYDYLLRSVVVPHWTGIEAGWYSRTYPNMRQRTLARLAWKESDAAYFATRSYYRAFVDEDLHHFAIASDLLYVSKTRVPGQTGTDPSAEETQVLMDIETVALRVFEQRIEGNSDFHWQLDVWKDHPDYAFDGCEGPDLPTKPCPRQRPTTEDISHSYRWPWWLQSLRDAWPKGSSNFVQFSKLAGRFGDEVLNSVVEYKDERPIFRNYLGGGNGWYRVGYNKRKWAYGPYSLSDIIPLGDYYVAGEGSNGSKRFSRRVCEILASNDAADIAFRTKYYGAQSGKASDPAGYGDLDPSAADSPWRFQCALAAKLHLF